MVDAGVGRVLREVEEVSPGAVIVITSDHGEALKGSGRRCRATRNGSPPTDAGTTMAIRGRSKRT
jgi:hypothetical protein